MSLKNKEFPFFLWPTMPPRDQKQQRKGGRIQHTHALGRNSTLWYITRVNHNNILCIIIIPSVLRGISLKKGRYTNIMWEYNTLRTATEHRYTDLTGPTLSTNCWELSHSATKESFQYERMLSSRPSPPRRNRRFLWHSLLHRITLSVTLQLKLATRPAVHGYAERAGRPASSGPQD